MTSTPTYPVSWRPEPLDQRERDLYDALIEAHFQSTFRNNASTAALVNAGVGSGSYANAIASAILTFGNLHGPVEQCLELLMSLDPALVANLAVEDNKVVPGWGSTFTEPDDSPWKRVEDLLIQHDEWNREYMEPIRSITAELRDLGKKLLPNPACWTAAVCLALRIPAAICLYPIFMARIEAWTVIFTREMAKQKEVAA